MENDLHNNQQNPVKGTSSIFQNALHSSISKSSNNGEKHLEQGTDILQIQHKLRKDSLMKQRMSITQPKGSLPNFINFQQMIDRTNSLIPRSVNATLPPGKEFYAPVNYQKMSKNSIGRVPDPQKISPAIEIVQTAIPTTNQAMIK